MLPGERKYLEFVYRQFGAVYKNRTAKVVFTFDDGPHYGLSEKLAKLLYEKGVSAIFFVTGERILQHFDLMGIYAKFGHLVGLHGFGHGVDDIKKNRKRLRELLSFMRSKGHPVKYIRPPYGLFDKFYLDFLNENDLRLFMWNHTTYDYKCKDPEKFALRVASQIKAGDILLMHDSEKTVAIYPEGINLLLDKLKDAGIKVGAEGFE